MKRSSASPLRPVLLLLLLCAALVFIWMLPVLLAGFPPSVPGIDTARDLVDTGIFTAGAARLTALFLSLWHGVIAWENVVGWTWLNAVVMAGSVFVLWFLVRRLFDETTAWVAIVLYALMPLYWLEAVRISGYALCLLFLFSAALAFDLLRKRHFWWALAAAGLLLGFTVAAKDAFVTFVPGVCLFLLWSERKHWKRALLSAGLFGFCSLVGFFSPILVPVLQSDGSLHERVALFVEQAHPREAGLNHLYPDDYTYEFNREEFDAALKEKAETGTFFERRAGESYRMLFGVQERTIFSTLQRGTWLLLNQIPQLTLAETTGGFFLWLFILPGIAIAWSRHKQLLVFYGWMILFTELVLRFGLLFVRSHIMDTAWGLAILAAVGVVGLAPLVQKQWKRLREPWVLVVITALIAGQMVQANRKHFAELYARSDVPAVFAANDASKALPENAVVAHPSVFHLFLFSDNDNIAIHPSTIARLAPQGKLREPFDHYGVTHILGYSAEDAAAIKKALPGITVITPDPSSHAMNVTPFMRYLLHIVR